MANFEARGEDNRGGFFVNLLNPITQSFNYFLEIDTISRDSLPVFVNRLNTAFIRQVTDNKDFDIEVTVAMLKNTLPI